MPNVPNGWQPMETAPKDGSRILVAYPMFNRGNTSMVPDFHQTMIVKWNGVGWDAEFGWLLHEEPAGWQPLPEWRTP